MGALGGQDRKTQKRSQLLGPLGAILGPSWGPLGAVLALGSPSWGVLGRHGALLSRLKIDVKIDQKNNAFQDRFLCDFTGFWEGKWRHVGPKIEQKSMPTSKSDFLKNRALPAAGARFSRFWVSNLGIKINEKSIQKWNQDGKASWHRFLMDFGGFLEASWEGKWSQDRSQEASKKRWKNGRHQDRHKMRIRRPKAWRNQGSRALGRG